MSRKSDINVIHLVKTMVLFVDLHSNLQMCFTTMRFYFMDAICLFLFANNTVNKINERVCVQRIFKKMIKTICSDNKEMIRYIKYEYKGRQKKQISIFLKKIQN